MAKAKAGPVVSDNGNFIIDAPFGPEHLSNPYEVSLYKMRELRLFWYPFHLEQLLSKIKMLTGVVEVGLFCGMAKAAYFGNEASCFQHTFNVKLDPFWQDGSVSVRWADGKKETVQGSQWCLQGDQTG
jgi:ribose 5-phosphate isomerase A